VTETVLVVDDSPFIVEGLVALLKKTYRAIPSLGGEECLRILVTEKPSVIILDIMMEPMDGWETLARIKEDPRTRHIPVLMFSAKKVSFEEAEAHRIRIDDFLTKPVSPKELLAAVARIIERQNQKKRTLSHWTGDGVPTEKIEEYLTLSSNLDIDTSLLAIMKKQLAHPSITDMQREELSSSVGVLMERIRVTESRIGAFLRDNGVSVPSGTDSPDMQAAPEVTHPGEIPQLPHESDSGKIPPMDSVSGSIPGKPDETADPAQFSPPQPPGSPDLILPPQPDPAPETLVVPVTADDEILHPREPVLGFSSEPWTEADPVTVADHEPVPENNDGEAPHDFESLFESEPRPEDHRKVESSSGSTPDLSPGNDVSSPVGPMSNSLRETVPDGEDPSPHAGDPPLVHLPDISFHGRDVKIPSFPESPPDTGSSGRGLLAITLRHLFSGR
jgi:two-component system, OmpR family, response regulator